MVISVYSPKGTYDSIFLSNYSSINLLDTLSRVKGVSKVTNLGARDYSMRMWLHPDRLTALGLTASDVIAAIRDQNVQASPGAIGSEPAPASQQFQYTLTAQGRLEDVKQFEDIIFRLANLLEDTMKIALTILDVYHQLFDGNSNQNMLEDMTI